MVQGKRSALASPYNFSVQCLPLARMMASEHQGVNAVQFCHYVARVKRNRVLQYGQPDVLAQLAHSVLAGGI